MNKKNIIVITIFVVLVLIYTFRVDSKVVNKENISTINNFPQSQRSLDGFYLGQHIDAIKNVLGEPDKVFNEKNNGQVYTYILSSKEGPQDFLAFSVYDVESKIVSLIQLTGHSYDREAFLGLKLGDSKDKVVGILGVPSKIESGTRDSDLYIYDNRNYSVQISKENKLISIRIAFLEGYETDPLIDNSYINNFISALNTGDISQISEFLMPDIEIYVNKSYLKINQRFLDEFSDPNSDFLNQLLFTKDSVRNILNNYSADPVLEMRITQEGYSGWVFKFPDSEILKEIFLLEHAGKWRIWEIKYVK
jgi:hypothetical protein